MSPGTIHAITSLLITMAQSAARSIALGCFAAVALAAFRVKNIRTSIFAWRTVLIAGLAMPLLISLCPAVQLPLPLPTVPTGSVPTVVRQMQTVAASSAAPDPISRMVQRPPERLRMSSEDYSKTAEKLTVSNARHYQIAWLNVGLLAYLAVAMLLCARVLVGTRLGMRLVRASTPIEDDRALRMLSACALEVGLLALPRLAESEVITVPVMLGVGNPSILLPSSWRQWNGSELAAVLAHELSHVKRRDALLQRAALIHRAIFWFSPFAWWLERHLAELSEQASDEAALAGGADSKHYAEMLLRFFAEIESGAERVAWHGVSMAKAGQAEKRLDRILAWRGAMSSQLRKSLVILLVAIAAPVVALTAAVHPATYDVQPPATPPAPQAPAAPKAEPSPAANPAEPVAPASAADPAPAQAPEPPWDETSSDDPGPTFHIVIPRIPMPAIPPMPSIRIPPIPPMVFATSGNWNYFRGFQGGYFVGHYSDWGPRFVIVTRDSDSLTMSGDPGDAEHAKSLQSKIPGEFIWFEHDDKSYVIRDQATVDRAKKLWEPQEKLSKDQEDLGKQQESLVEQQEEAARKMEEMKLKVPDLTSEMQKLEAEMKQLSANGGTMEDIGNLQGELGELQSRIGEVESNAGRNQGSFGREQGELGRKQGELGRRQGELGRQQAELAREASRQMKQLLDDAIAHGLAKPE